MFLFKVIMLRLNNKGKNIKLRTWDSKGSEPSHVNMLFESTTPHRPTGRVRKKKIVTSIRTSNQNLHWKSSEWVKKLSFNSEWVRRYSCPGCQTSVLFEVLHELKHAHISTMQTLKKMEVGSFVLLRHGLLLKQIHSKALGLRPSAWQTYFSASIRTTQGKGQEVAYLFQSRFQEYQSET